MSIQLVVFDMAGTTVHDENNVAITLQEALAQYGYAVTIEEVNVVMGYPKPDAIAELLKKFNGDAMNQLLVKEIHSVFVEKMIDFYANSPLIREKEGVTETFRRLKAAGVKVGIDTGFSRDITDVILQRMGWNKEYLVDVSITSDEVPHGRPYPDMIFRAMELLNITDVANVAKVGDTVSDLMEGTSAGCRFVIGITTGAYTREELSRSESTHLIDEITEVADIVLESEAVLHA